MVEYQKTGNFPFYFETGLELVNHQFIIVPNTVCTTGFANILVSIGEYYSKIQGVEIPLFELRPIPLSGRYKRFKLEAYDSDCSDFTVTYVGA